MLADQKKLTFIISVLIPGAVLITCQERWLIGTKGARVKGIYAVSAPWWLLWWLYWWFYCMSTLVRLRNAKCYLFFNVSYGFKYSYLIQIICTPLFGLMYRTISTRGFRSDCLNENVLSAQLTIMKKINVSFIVHFCLGKYSCRPHNR